MKEPPWLLVEPGLLEAGDRLELGSAEARHAVGPLRLRSGDAVVLADGAGTVAQARLWSVARNRVEAEVLELESEPRPAGGGVTLAMAVVEARAMEWAVQKAVEVGVRTFVPMLAERTQAGRRDVVRRSPHLERVARQALKQCRRAWAMRIEDPVTLPDLVQRTPPATGVAADRAGGAASSLPAADSWVLAVGPEGGFSADELRVHAEHGWYHLRLGPHVLRAETAAVVGAAVLVGRVRDG